MFTLKTDRARKLLVITLDGGFWDVDQAARFKIECAAAVASLGCQPGTHFTLVDFRNSVLQSQAVFDRLLAIVRASVAARLALVAESPIARMQTKRLQIRDTVRLFSTMAEAEAWLATPTGNVRAA